MDLPVKGRKRNETYEMKTLVSQMIHVYLSSYFILIIGTYVQMHIILHKKLDIMYDILYYLYPELHRA